MRKEFLRSKAEILAEYLRVRIVSREIAEPLSNLHEWSAKLGVGWKTLQTALRILECEGLVHIKPGRGIYLKPPAKRSSTASKSNLVRWITSTKDSPPRPEMREITSALAETLHRHKIDFSIENCNPEKLRRFCQNAPASELYALSFLSAHFHKHFEHLKNTLVFDLPSSGIRLPFISVDIISALRHAVNLLVHRGFHRIYLVVFEKSSFSSEIFSKICQDNSRSIMGGFIRIPSEIHAQAQAASRLAATARAGDAFIALYPIPVSILITALTRRQLDVPRQVEAIAMNTLSHDIRVLPIPTYYPYPLNKLTKAFCRISMHYFNAGVIFPSQTLIPLEIVRSDQ